MTNVPPHGEFFPEPENEPREPACQMRPAKGMPRCLAWASSANFCLPALGVTATAGLLLLVNAFLLSNLDRNLPPDGVKHLSVRVFLDKPGGNQELVGRPFRPAGTVGSWIEKYKTRATSFDMAAKQLTFLTTWAVANLLQGALTLLVIVLSLRAIIVYTPWRPWKQAAALLGPPLAILAATVGTLAIIDALGILPLKLDSSILHDLQLAMQEQTGMHQSVQRMTSIGNISIVVVTFVIPTAVGILLTGQAGDIKRRIATFQHLMYWTGFLLVIGVIQVTYQNRWPSLFFDDDTSIQHVNQMAAGAGLLVGGVFTVASGLVFLPAGFSLHRQDDASPSPEATTFVKSWFSEVLSVLAPVIAAIPIAKLFEFLQ